LRYNAPNPWLPDLLVCRADIASEVLAALGHLGVARA
jgi:3'(2'), 5'-bisphosphate nucleotidase